MKPRQHGYTLIEILVVVAMIGVMILVVVPNFIGYMRTIRMRTSVRQFTTDVRQARQTAITRHVQTKLSFKTDATGEYWFSRRNEDCSGVGTLPDPDPCWQSLGARKAVQKNVFFNSTSTFTDVASGITPDPDGFKDVVYGTDGTVTNLPGGTGTVVIATNDDVPKNQYTITFWQTGRLVTN
ncbi:MAG: prepilin-type N-terminal cleavage/methylation domain-containing protein [Acidobacteriota bacterium]